MQSGAAIAGGVVDCVAVFRGRLFVVLAVGFEEDGQRGAGDAELGGFLGGGEGADLTGGVPAHDLGDHGVGDFPGSAGGAGSAGGGERHIEESFCECRRFAGAGKGPRGIE